MLSKNTVYTIGHSTHDIEEFEQMLKSFNVVTLVDVRRFPGSKRYPQYNKESLENVLRISGIVYIHLEGLGGRRKAAKNSKNNRWRNESFRGYADYMETYDFKEAISKLESISMKGLTAYMCAEAVWWSCHRSMISDYLKAKQWTVYHIMGIGKAEEHPYTSPAIIKDGNVIYSDDTLFNG